MGGARAPSACRAVFPLPLSPPAQHAPAAAAAKADGNELSLAHAAFGIGTQQRLSGRAPRAMRGGRRMTPLRAGIMSNCSHDYRRVWHAARSRVLSASYAHVTPCNVTLGHANSVRSSESLRLQRRAARAVHDGLGCCLLTASARVRLCNRRPVPLHVRRRAVRRLWHWLWLWSIAHALLRWHRRVAGIAAGSSRSRLPAVQARLRNYNNVRSRGRLDHFHSAV